MKFGLFFLSLNFVFFASCAIAQNIPNNPDIPPPVLPTPKKPLPLQPLPPLEDVLPSEEQVLPGWRLTPEQIPGKIIIERFEVVGSTVFSQAELAAILKPYTLRSISFAEILEAQQVITQLYVENGYITSGAFIPPQEIKDRVIRIEIQEGSVEAINITGLERLNSKYVYNRLQVATAAPLNRDKLLNALQLLQLDPLIANLSAELDLGTTVGASILSVEVKEADVFDVQLALDNNRAPSVGTDRRIVRLSHGNLLGFGDRLSAAYINTDGSDSLDDLTYTIPVNARNGTVSFTYRYSDGEIIEEPADVLDIKSTRSTYQATYRQPLYQTPTEDFSLGLIFTRDESEVEFGEDFFRFIARNTELDRETKISAVRFFQEYTSRNIKEVLALRSQFSVGIDVFDPTIKNNDEPDSEFFVWRGQAQYLRLLSPGTSFLLRLDTQLANDNLVPIEQFSLGGAFTVRGYRQDALIADNGIFASVEIRPTIVRISEWSTTLQLTPFLDIGHVWNINDLELRENILLSLGVGLRLLVSDYLTARIDWGIPLIDLDDNDRTLQEDGIHFSVKANF
ncbi:MAG: ShlB/FhaC/HecB family hemolysin secretion/activation protein [Xenococcaceae cyanobacterium MO_188.B32]|nr:ShlB/FhaC/HecB family hemolysin secretion/activation protein [Xenococcaceae cyanobacterium MO_188.B32]